MPEILVSVVVLAYNAAETVEHALRSVCEQRTSFGIEILVWDDASTDATAERVREVLSGQGRPWTLTTAPDNVFSTGRSPLLLMLDDISGRYVARLDADDYWCDPGKLQKQVDLLESHPSSVLSCTGFDFVDADGARTRTMEMPGTTHVPYSRLQSGNFIAHSSVVYRTEILHGLPPSWERLTIRDYALWGWAAVGTDILVVPDVTTAYRIHPGAAWSSLPDAVRLEREMDGLDWLADNLDGDVADAWRLQRMRLERHASAERLAVERELSPGELAEDKRVLLDRMTTLDDELREAAYAQEGYRAELGRVAGLEQGLAAERETTRRLSADLEAARSSAESAQEHLATVLGSSSWRVTAPLRRVRLMFARRR